MLGIYNYTVILTYLGMLLCGGAELALLLLMRVDI